MPTVGYEPFSNLRELGFGTRGKPNLTQLTAQRAAIPSHSVDESKRDNYLFRGGHKVIFKLTIDRVSTRGVLQPQNVPVRTGGSY